MRCPRCRFDNPEDARFCEECGATLALACPGCGAPVRPGQKFCRACGLSLLPTRPAAAAEGLRDIGPMAPAAASSRPHAEAAPPESRSPAAERRQLTVLFCDLVGSTELASRLDPEDLREVIRAYHECCSEVIGRLGGHVAKYLGDGVLAYFGYPQAHEDDAERAVRAGLALVEVVGELAPGHGLAGLRARVGIATGLVVVGELIGTGAAMEQSVVGETMNLAARLQEAAEPGGVVIAAATQRLVGGLFDYAPPVVRPLKGFAEPVTVWRVIGEGAAEGRFEARQSGTMTPLIGREQEIALLLDRAALAEDGEGQVVLLCGEPGIGKSRVTLALRERMADRPHVRLRYSCSPFYTNTALHPVIEQMERAAGFARGDTAEQRLVKLERLLAQAVADVAEVAPLFAALLSIPTEEGRYPPLNLSPQRQKERTFEALIAQLEGLAAKQPVLTVFEDVHWIDPTTLELLDRTVDRVQGLPVLLLVTFRPEFSPPWTGHPHVTLLTLNRLGRRQGTAMIERVAGKPVPPEVLEQIVAKTDGVPLFVEELTKAVLESGLLRDEGDAYALAGPLAPLAVPATLHDSLAARLDRLAPVKEVAQIGATIGREFTYELLAAVAALPEHQLQQALAQLGEAELIFRHGTPPRATYTFKHALVQDAAYAGLLKSRRHELHARIARVLEERFPETVAAQPELLAHHYTQAGLTDAAIACWQRAGRQALERSANAEAVGHLSRGLALLATLPETPERIGRELAFETALGPALMATKGYGAPEVVEAYSRARARCQRLGDTPQLFPVLFGLWAFHIVRGDLHTALDLGAQLLRPAEAAADPDLLLEAHTVLGVTLYHAGEPAASWKHLDHVRSHYDPERHRGHAFTYGQDPGMACRAYGALALHWLGDAERAARISREGLDLAHGLGHAHSLAFALFFAARFYQHRGETDRARECAEAALDLSAEQGFPIWRSQAAIVLGWVVAAEGRLDDGIAQIHAGIAAWRATGAGLWEPYWLALLADACGRAGRTEEAAAALDEALAIAERRGERIDEPDLHRLRGELLLRDGAGGGAGADEAEACFRRAIEVARRQGAAVPELRAAISLGRALAARGERRRARDALDEVCGRVAASGPAVTPDLSEARTLAEQWAS